MQSFESCIETFRPRLEITGLAFLLGIDGIAIPIGDDDDEVSFIVATGLSARRHTIDC